MNPRTRRLRRLRRNQRRSMQRIKEVIRNRLREGLKGYIGVPNNEEARRYITRFPVQYLGGILRPPEE